MTLGERVKKLREERGWSQLELATKLGLTSSAVSLLEKDERKPSFEVLKKMSDIFGVSVDYLMGRTDEIDEVQMMFRGAAELSPEFQDMLKGYIQFLRNEQAKKRGGKSNGNQK